MTAAAEDGLPRLLDAFHRAASAMPWYRTLLDEHGIRPGDVHDASSFTRVPVLTKQNTFARFPLGELAAGTPIRELAGVLTSSGHGGRFSFGLSTRSQAAAGAGLIDSALDAAFGVRSRPTLAVNCLPMGVGFNSECMTIATTSVREDMAVALVDAFGHHYDQVLLVADPLFMKRLTDYAAARHTDWRRHRINVVLGEEIFGEHFRGYVAACLGLDVTQPNHGFIMSSFGVGELGLHLCYETPATIAVRRAAWASPGLAADVLGAERPAAALPMILAFNPQRTFTEVLEPDAAGYGDLTISMLDGELPIPLLRYQTGDRARLLDPAAVSAALRRHGVAVPAELPATMLALEGRVKEVLPNGSHVGVYKDALYADHACARRLTGAFRVVASGTSCTLHVQLAPSQPVDDSITGRILAVIPPAARPAGIVLWPYEGFPFGMTVDYERKFPYYVPA